MIYHLSVNPKSSTPGWCYMSRVNMAEELGLTKSGILALLCRLENSGFIEKNKDTKFLRTTEKWYSHYLTDGTKSVPLVQKVLDIGTESVPDVGTESVPNNNIIDINNNNKHTWSKDHTLKIFIIDNTKNIVKLDAPSFEQCEKIYDPLIKLNFTKAEAHNKVIEFVEQMENYKPLLKKYKSFYLTINNWIKRAIDNDTIKIKPRKNDIAANF